MILGNHRDAWVFGGVDPNSGTAALMELARTLSLLRGNGRLLDTCILYTLLLAAGHGTCTHTTKHYNMYH